MARGFGAPKPTVKFRGRYGPKNTGLLKSAWGKPPKAPGPPKPRIVNIAKTNFPKVGKIGKR